MKTLEELKTSYEDIIEFKDEHDFYTYRIDYKARKLLNEILGSCFVAVFREEKRCGKFDAPGKSFSLDCETIYCVKPNGKVVQFTNSEWGGVEELS